MNMDIYEEVDYYLKSYMAACTEIYKLEEKLNKEKVSVERLWNLVDYLMDPSHDEEEKLDMKFNYEMWLERKENRKW